MTGSGDVVPADPATWTSSTVGYVGNTSIGGVTVNSGGILLSAAGYVGYATGASGTVLVDGVGSKWTDSGILYVGEAGSGVLNVTNGGAVTNTSTYVGDNATGTGTITLTGKSSFWKSSGTLFLGNYGTGLLSITNGAQGSVTSAGYLGNNVGSLGTLNVDGTGSKWIDSGILSVGEGGNGVLNVTNGGTVTNTSSYVGDGATSTGTVTLTGKSSFWKSSGTLFLGNYGTGLLSITNGAQGSVTSTGYLGNNVGSLGTLTVGGTGSKWSSAALYVGASGMGVLSVSNGGTVSSISSYIGGMAGGVGTAGVAGPGSLWNSGVLYVGNSGSGSLTIANGGSFISANAYLGYNVGSTGTTTVDGTGSTWTGTGNTVYVGYSGVGALNITNGGKLTDFSGNLGWYSGSNGTATVDGTGSTWTNNGSLFVGNGGTGSLNIKNDGEVSNTGWGTIGFFPSAAGTVTVDGAGSTWTNSSSLSVGVSGTGTLNIINGGIVTVAGTTEIAYGGAAMGQVNFGVNGGTLSTRSLYAGLAQFTGTGTINTHGILEEGNLTIDATHGLVQTLSWTGDQQSVTIHLDLTGGGSVVGDLGAGYLGAGTLTIRDGLNVTSGTGHIGYQSSAAGTVLVVGTGSTWTNSNNLFVGDSGSGSLSILQGASVGNPASYIANNTGSSGLATVDGTSSTWTHSDNLYVGNSGAGVLTVSNGGRVNDATGYLGYNAGATGIATVGGSGSTWINSNNLSVGNSGTGTLTITNGGTVSDSQGYVGYNAGSAGSVLINGASSTWTNSGYLYVGVSGTGTLNITAGGRAMDATGSMGASTGATGAALVDGSGSTWTNGGVLTLGDYGYALLTISNAGNVSNTIGTLGNNAGATGTAIVSGAGSMWTNIGPLYVGSSGAGLLSISDAGQVSNYDSYLGNGTAGMGTVTVDGIGSTWTSFGFLTVGFNGSGLMVVTHGGTVNDQRGRLGGSFNYSGHGRSGGTVTVDGAGSMWANSVDLIIGNYGLGMLTILNGGSVSDTGAYLGYDASATGVVTVDGLGSTWTNTGPLVVGFSGSGTLNITYGGIVTVSGVTSVNSKGMVNFGSNGGTLTTQSFTGLPAQITGTATLYTLGVFTDGNLLCDAAHGANQTLNWVNAQQNVTIHLDLTGGSGSAGDLAIGCQGTGTLTVRDGVKINTGSGYLGFSAGTIGTATVEGTGSTWNNSSALYVGKSGAGLLTVNNGGSLNDATGYLGYSAGATGRVIVNGAGSTWNCGNQLYVGYSGTGTFCITNGGLVIGYDGFVAYQAGSAGTAIVDGSGSFWYMINDLWVGNSGLGTLSITNGGRVYDNGGHVSRGVVTIDGAGSLWTNLSYMFIGTAGQGTVTITNGGALTAAIEVALINSSLTMNVGDGSSLSAGGNELYNNGLICLRAVVGAIPGPYTPIVAGQWVGSGTLTALGGSWNSTTHVFTVTTAVSGAAGTAVGIDTAVAQRVVITDATAIRNVVAGFQSTATSSSLTLTGNTLTPAEVAALASKVAAGEGMLAGWTFTTSGYTAGNPVSLAMDIGAGYYAGSLAVWHYDGTAWTSFAATDLSYDGNYANFTVTGFSGYAVTTLPVSTAWNGANGNWSEAAKWSPGVPQNGTPAACNYDATITGGNVTLDADAFVNTLLLSGGTLAGAHNVTLSYGGSVTGTYNVTGTTTISAGSLTFGGAAHNAGAFAGAGKLVINPGATLTSDAVNVSTLIINGTHILRPNSAGISKISHLTIAPSAALDLTNHDLIIGNSTLAAVEAQILKGFGKAGSPGDPAITSSTALANQNTFLVPIDADALLGNGLAGSAVGKFFDNTALTDPGTILVKYAYLGDITLDGKVDALDLATAAGHFGQATPGLADIQTAWLMGDYNFNGTVDAQDFALMNSNLGQSLPQAFPLAFNLQTPIPEPTTALTLLAGTLLLLKGDRTLFRRPRPRASLLMPHRSSLLNAIRKSATPYQ